MAAASSEQDAPRRSGFPDPSPRWALFLDFDGTLVDIAPRPQDVVVPRTLIDVLRAAHDALDGAVALVSGRPIADLDRLTVPLRLAAAGQHGLEWRTAPDGELRHLGGDPALLDNLRARFAALAQSHPGLDIEDKTCSLSVHYRMEPEAGPAVIALATEHLPPGDQLHLMLGKMVVEIKPAGIDKGHIVDKLLTEPPFAGRVPVFVGDDRTDEDGFAAVNRSGGVSLRVGPPPSWLPATCAQWECRDVAAFVGWLATLPDRLRVNAATTARPI
jgi:trehalose 6-phosphate phosphatase